MWFSQSIVFVWKHYYSQEVCKKLREKKFVCVLEEPSALNTHLIIVKASMQTLSSTHFADHLAATLFQGKKHNSAFPCSCSLLFSSFLPTSTAVYWRLLSQYTRIVCKASVHQRCHYLAENMKLSFVFSLYNITSFIPNNRTKPDWLMTHKSLELGSQTNCFSCSLGLKLLFRRLDKFQNIPVNTEVCFLGKYKTKGGKFQISLKSDIASICECFINYLLQHK